METNHSIQDWLPGDPRNEKIVSRVRDLAESVSTAEGLELVFVEFLRESGGRTLRIFIDKPDGVGLDDCVAVSRQLGDLLDAAVDITGTYNLEVSSPGPKRPLGRRSDMERFKGHLATIKTRRPVDGQRNFKGTIGGIREDQVLLISGDRTVALDIPNIARARLII